MIVINFDPNRFGDYNYSIDRRIYRDMVLENQGVECKNFSTDFLRGLSILDL